MLTYKARSNVVVIDRPWTLFLMLVVWLISAGFYHSPWEPYEPYVASVVKAIIVDNTWVTPYISYPNPYLEIHSLYFVIYALFVKVMELFHVTNIINIIRIVNLFFIALTVYFIGLVSRGLLSHKTSRSIIMILISTLGFIITSYQISPHIIVLLGFIMIFYALKKSNELPGKASAMMSIGLILVATHFNAEYIVVAGLLSIILPIVKKSFRNSGFLITNCIAYIIFILVVSSYLLQIYHTNPDFFRLWAEKYLNFYAFDLLGMPTKFSKYFFAMIWFLFPASFLAVWTIYKRRKKIFKNDILLVSVISAILIFLVALIDKEQNINTIFPLVVPAVLLAVAELDSVPIETVDLLNFFSIVLFGLICVVIILFYFFIMLWPSSNIVHYLNTLNPNYSFRFSLSRLFIALSMLCIWVFMVTRKSVRGREMVSNWAGGTTCCLAMFFALCLPWLDSALSFEGMVKSSVPYINSKYCIATNQVNHIQSALWYYYADVHLLSSNDIMNSGCKQALVVVYNYDNILLPGWKVLWQYQKPMDIKRYILMSHNDNNSVASEN